MRYCFLLGFILLAVVPAEAKPVDTIDGVDFTQPATNKQMECLKENKIDRAFIRAYVPLNGGMFDSNACNTLLNIYNDFYAQIYMVPSPKGSKSGADQFNEMYNGFDNCGSNQTFFYLHVTSPQNWNANPTANIKFLKDVVVAANLKGWDVAIHTDQPSWKAITNNMNYHDLQAKSTINLWVANAQAPQNLGDFKPFGGWTAGDVLAMQYDKPITVCGVACKQDKLFTRK